MKIFRTLWFIIVHRLHWASSFAFYPIAAKTKFLPVIAMFEDQLFTKVLKDQAIMIKTGHATNTRFFGISKPLKGQTKFRA